MNLEQLIDKLQSDSSIKANLTAWQTLPPVPARYADFPAALDPRIVAALGERSIRQLYTHQSQAVEAALARKNVVVVTPTASGKTLCYNLPVLNEILRDPASRALYMFPTKALAQDQVVEVKNLAGRLGADIKSYVYDGDTPPGIRQVCRQAGHIVITNPDMLHTGVLPHHTKWVKLFENLKYVVIDELHQYRGVFGSHLANLLRRLRRICEFYGSNPVFLCSSATIANPRELAENLLEQPVTLIDENGAPRGAKHVALYNPPMVGRDGLRESSVKAATRVAAELLKNNVQTIVFARSRQNVELLTSYLRERVGGSRAAKIFGYRGGYRPNERRDIEAGLRSGDIMGVVSTNALELGIDIGQLQACVMCGFPGTIASAWQQAGRAGRRGDASLTVMVGSSSPLDQYVITHPEFFFHRSPELGLINPDNLLILVSHLKCAAFELPFVDGEKFGVETTAEILGYLEEEKILRHAGGKWHWSAENFPAENISLRSVDAENVVIIDTSVTGQTKVLGEIDQLGAMTMVHTNAIYLHQGVQFHVDKLDWGEKKAYVHKVDVEYYTDANLAVTIKPLDVFKEKEELGLRVRFGEVMTAAKATIFKKIRLHTHENMGWGEIHLPEYEMHTAAYWVSLPDALTEGYTQDELQSALVGLGHLLKSLAPMYLMCDPQDLHQVVQVRSPFNDLPTVYLYDAYPAGIGLGEKCYDLHPMLLGAALDRVQSCGCESGCPSCVGPAAETGNIEGAKGGVLRLLHRAITGVGPIA
ncbi:MAG TPA: DEAD/DEAH box helicase [Symbiobacteriaceae bacterium]|nr:DEAD/DEAH box helicase [Symbiobacteriaceae bacterium]